MRETFNRFQLGNLRVFFSRLGYHASPNGSFERRLNRDGDFPRFHAYTETVGDEVTISLHLDAKAPSYSGTSAHAGEYEGPLVEAELQRIATSLPQPDPDDS